MEQMYDNKELIDLLTTISEVIWNGGLSLLDKMRKGNLDALMSADEENNRKIEFLKNYQKILIGDTFGELSFIVTTQTKDSNIEALISRLPIKDDGVDQLLKAAFRMYANQYRPWEVRYTLERINGQDVSIEKIFQTYLRDGESYSDCLNRYSEGGY